MLATIRTAAACGTGAYDATVEVDSALGMPQWIIVGLPWGTADDARERIGAAIVASGFTVPPRRLVVHVAPIKRPKAANGFDVPIALGLLVATGQLAAVAVRHLAAVGELGPGGVLRAIRGAPAIARRVASHAQTTLVLPPANLAAAWRASRAPLWAPASITELAYTLRTAMSNHAES